MMILVVMTGPVTLYLQTGWVISCDYLEMRGGFGWLGMFLY